MLFIILLIVAGALGATLSWILYLRQFKRYSFKKLTPQGVKAKVAEDDAYVFFYSPNCPVCLQAAPLIYDAAGEAGTRVFSLNKDRFDVEPWGVSKTPVLAVYREGKETGRISGVQSKEKYLNFLEEYKSDDTVH
ncbi:MAG: thioredoxin family protein [Bacillota bacterium]